MSNILKIKQFPEVEKCKVIQHLKNEINIRARINYKKNVVDMVCECGAPLKYKNSYNKHITTDKHINNMKIKYGNQINK